MKLIFDWYIEIKIILNPFYGFSKIIAFMIEYQSLIYCLNEGTLCYFCK